MNKKTNDTPQHHYFASNAYGWGTGSTRQEACEKLARSEGVTNMKSMILRAHERSEAGAYMWSCRVETPEDTAYAIEYYQPAGVDINSGRCHHITFITRYKIGIYTTDRLTDLTPIDVDDSAHIAESEQND